MNRMPGKIFIACLTLALHGCGKSGDNESSTTAKTDVQNTGTDAKESNNNAIQGRIVIATDAARIWEVLTNPDKIILYTGSEAKTDWQVGSPITWEGEMQGMKYQNKGQVLRNDEHKLLEYTFWTGMGGDQDLPENYSIVAFELNALSDTTTELTYTRTRIPTQMEKQVFEEHLQSMLEGIKKLSEE